jgi:hypothetical protein
MATNQTGIAIVIKAFLPTGKTLDETYAALTVVKTAHETGDYAPLLSIAKIDEVKTEQKTRRVEEMVAIVEGSGDVFEDLGAEKPTGLTEPAAIADEVLGTNITGANDADTTEDIPAFLKSKKSAKAA